MIWKSKVHIFVQRSTGNVQCPSRHIPIVDAEEERKAWLQEFNKMSDLYGHPQVIIQQIMVHPDFAGQGEVLSYENLSPNVIIGSIVFKSKVWLRRNVTRC
jgi:hypothetical protein